MLFKNLILYRLPENWSVPAAELEEALNRRPLQPCSGFDMQTRGFVACGHEERLLYTQGRHHLLALGVDRKLLPASVINQQAKERATELAAQQGYPVGRRQMRDLKARVTDELRARALTSRRSTHAWLNLPQGWLAVNTTSAARAEEVVETLRETLGSFAVQPVLSQDSPAGAMAAWLTQGRVPGRFSIDQDLELQAVDGLVGRRPFRHRIRGQGHGNRQACQQQEHETGVQNDPHGVASAVRVTAAIRALSSATHAVTCVSAPCVSS